MTGPRLSQLISTSIRSLTHRQRIGTWIGANVSEAAFRAARDEAPRCRPKRARVAKQERVGEAAACAYRCPGRESIRHRVLARRGFRRLLSRFRAGGLKCRLTAAS